MTPKLTIRRKLLIGVLTACLIPFILGIIYIKTQTESWLFNNNLEQSQILIEQAATYVDDSVLFGMQNMTKLLTLDERIINVDQGINQYTNYDSDTVCCYSYGK